MQTTSSSYFSGLRDSLTSLGIDYGRSRLIDVETRSDDKNIPDRADIEAQGKGVAGVPTASIVVVGLVALCVVGVIIAVARR